MAATYRIEVPTWGWRREKIEIGEDWLGNLALPTVVVDDEQPGDYSLSVGLVEQIGGNIEIASAEIQRWVADETHPDGGFWGQPRQVPFGQIELVQ